MNTQIVDKWLTQFPVLETFIAAGTISLKMAREILDVDRWFMNEIFKELLVAGAVKAYGSVQWRATPELKEYLNKRKAERNGEPNEYQG